MESGGELPRATLCQSVPDCAKFVWAYLWAGAETGQAGIAKHIGQNPCRERAFQHQYGVVVEAKNPMLASVELHTMSLVQHNIGGLFAAKKPWQAELRTNRRS